MKNILIIILFNFFLYTMFAQDDKGKNSNVELPDFVITGSDVVTLQKGKKIEPGSIPILNQQFLKPNYSFPRLIKKQFGVCTWLKKWIGVSAVL